MEIIICCPCCRHYERIKEHTSYNTQNHGERKIYRCSKCGCFFSETKNTPLAGLKKHISLIIQVIQARTEGMGLNAASRVFGISKNTILDWERRLAGLKPTLLLYALAHTFLQQIIEGDEIYTRIKKNAPADQSKGWTAVLMDRASRFIWELKCGKRDRKLFRAVIKSLCKVIRRTKDISLITDGERRYSIFLFDLCSEVIRNGKPGRPKKTLRKGVKVRIKNKGSQAHKRGPKRKKYQRPCPEHPDTKQDINNKDIHANHCEGFNSSLRRKNSAYRRRTNTYAKEDKCLQRTLDVYWIVHNFVRVHFTTKEVPAVALGIISKGLSLEEVFMLPRAA